MRLRMGIAALFRLLWASFLVLTSAVCLLAFLPYTLHAFVKAPPYEWMSLLLRHHAALYGGTLALLATAEWLTRRRRWVWWFVAAQGGAAAVLAVRPLLSLIRDDWTAYLAAVTALLPPAVYAALDLAPHWRRLAAGEPAALWRISYVKAGTAAAALALVYATAAVWQSAQTEGLLPAGEGRLIAWSLVSHLLLVFAVVSAVNLIPPAGAQTPRPALLQHGGLLLLGAAAMGALLYRLLTRTLGLEGAAGLAYAAVVALSVVLFLASLGRSVAAPPTTAGSRALLRAGVLMAALVVVLAAIAVPPWVQERDWDGVLQGLATLAAWSAVGVVVWLSRERERTYSLAAVLAVVLVSGSAYAGMKAAALWWAAPLGATEDEIARTMEAYGARNASFQFAHNLLGNAPRQECGEWCGVLRQYANIRGFTVQQDLDLVEELRPGRVRPPHVFILVLDSVRPDYLGAYNPRVTFTPHLDAFARESIVLRNAFTPYAGTTLAEASLWAGSLLLHSHYMQPFRRINSLEKLARAEGYQVVVSYDTVLSQLLSPEENFPGGMVRLDTDVGLWNRMEICATTEKLLRALEARPADAPPVLFFTHAMNVHQFAINDLPRLDPAWETPGFQRRISWALRQVDACLGRLFAALKARGLWEESIIIVTADHGEAGPGSGQAGHSLRVDPDIMRIPLLVRLPERLHTGLRYDDSGIVSLIDITPSLYYLLGHRPVRQHAILGRPLFVETREELERLRRRELLVASDVRPVFGLVAEHGRLLYSTQDSPPRSHLYDLTGEAAQERDLLPERQRREYDLRVLEQLSLVADFYGYKPPVSTMFAAGRRRLAETPGELPPLDRPKEAGP